MTIVRWARPKTDWELWGHSRTIEPSWNPLFTPTTPQTRPVYVTPAGGKDQVPYTEAWLDYLAAINTPAGFKMIQKQKAGLFNRGDNPRTADSLVACGMGNLVRVIGAIRNGAYPIAHFNIKDRPPDPKKINPHNAPGAFCLMTAVNRKGETVLPENGVVAWFPILAKAPVWWIRAEYIVFL